MCLLCAIVEKIWFDEIWKSLDYVFSGEAFSLLSLLQQSVKKIKKNKNR